MRLRSHRRNLVVWSQSASSVDRSGAPPFIRTRRIRKWIRTGALLTIVGLMPLARAGRARWCEDKCCDGARKAIGKRPSGYGS